VVNPDTIAAQMEGGALLGLTAALYGAITHKGGRMEQSNLRDYRPMFGEASCACVTPATPMRSSP
jgi:isoquinoline 1-oxidoreductase beta subunit